MKLLHIETREVEEVFDSELPPYATLSHTWSSQDTQAPTQWVLDRRLQRRLPVGGKILDACQATVNQGIVHLWVDSLCIDATSSADLDEAVNGSFLRLRRSSLCIVYLDDLPADGSPFDEDIWRQCRYWRRAWTLQELIVPSKVNFFDSQWNHRGSKSSPELLPMLANITGIPRDVLLDSSALFDISLAVRISWSADRSASREEDMAYSLVGITGVTLPVRYGEGAERAFLRLQEEMLRENCDGSIFAWRSASSQEIRGILARSPAEFRHFRTCGNSTWQGPWAFDGKIHFNINSKRLRVQSRSSRHGQYLLLEIGRPRENADSGETFSVYLREWNGIYVRVNSASLFRVLDSEAGHRKTIDVARDVDSRTSTKVSAWFNTMDQHIHTAGHASQAQSDKNNAVGMIHELPSRPARGLESPIQSSSEYDFRHVSPTVESSSTKRSRSGQPITLLCGRRSTRRRFSPIHSNSPDDNISSDSESGLDDSFSSSDSDYGRGFDSGSDKSLHDEDGAIEEYSLELDHEYQGVRSGLVQSAYDRIREWMDWTRYVAPPDNRLPPRKRARTTDWQPRSTYPEEKEDEDDPELIIVSPIDGYFHLACPFYVSDPERYRLCLLEHDLQSIEDVIHHLRQQHAQPPYCAMCSRTFDDAMGRDEHVRARACEFRSPGHIDGITELQGARLKTWDKLYLGEARRWRRVWVTVFPNSEPIFSPYLEEGVERAVSMVRDFWNPYDGKKFASQYLADRGLGLDGERALTALYRLTLKDLVTKTLEEHGRAKEAV